MLIAVRIIGGTIKTLMILGIIHYVAPGFSYESAKFLSGILSKVVMTK